jgi:hypothetical protein
MKEHEGTGIDSRAVQLNALESCLIALDGPGHKLVNDSIFPGNLVNG